MSAWIEKWLEVGYECNRDRERVPLRAKIAWFLAYRMKL